MRYIKPLRIFIVLIILFSHGINPLKRLIDILPLIKLRLTDCEKEYIIHSCSQKIGEYMRKMIYE